LASLRRLGHSKESVKMLGLMWDNMEHHVCTGFGISDKTYGSTIDNLMYEIGQGSCTSPILWALIHQLLLTTLGEKFTCIRLADIDGVEEHIRPGESFADDTTTGTTNDDPELEPVSTDQAELTTSREALISKMVEIIKKILDLLQVTGGDLAPEKSVWYLISHIWKDGKPRLLQKHISHHGIKMVSRSTNTESGVKRYPGVLHDWRWHMLCSQESYYLESISLRHCYESQLHLERGIGTCVQLLLPALARVWNSSDNSDSARMLQHPKTSIQCYPAKNGDHQESSQECCLWHGSIWQIRSGTPSCLSRTYPFAIPNGTSSVQQHHWKTDALNVGLYTTGMQLYRKFTGTRLRKVFKCYHDRKLDHWNMGTFALLQLNFEYHCEMETTTKSPERRRRDGITDRVWRLFRQRSQRYQSLQDIPLGFLHL
jgi:hypothetical protein